MQSLADSRFDWERVMRELALVLPSDVSLTELSASGSGAKRGGESGGSGGLGGGLSGPSMNMTGCAGGYEGVARFVTALQDIDGVTRVGVQSSEETAEGGGIAVGRGKTGECARRGGDHPVLARRRLRRGAGAGPGRRGAAGGRSGPGSGPGGVQ